MDQHISIQGHSHFVIWYLLYPLHPPAANRNAIRNCSGMLGVSESCKIPVITAIVPMPDFIFSAQNMAKAYSKTEAKISSSDF